MPNRLVVLDEQEYRELATVSHTAIVSYKYSYFDSRQELRITRRDAPPLRLRANGKLLEPGDFAGMVRAFEASIAAQPGSSAIIREKTFFEKRISTWLLGGLTLGALGLVWMVTTRPQPVRWGSLVSLLVYYLLYVALWWMARAQRRESENN